MAVKYILRFDDITPCMDWDKFNILAKIITDLRIKPIIGVVPENRDLKLNIGKENINFWDTIRVYQEMGWGIAQHGCYHQYTTKNGGILGLSNKSEFAGHSFDDQLKLIFTGKQILKSEGINTKLFMAPSHSFDKNTIRALIECKFKFITDGFGLYPYEDEGITFIPQLYASPVTHIFGIYTICFHTNSMSNKNINRLVKFIMSYRKKIISFEEALKYKDNSFMNKYIYRNCLKVFRKIKNNYVK